MSAEYRSPEVRQALVKGIVEDVIEFGVDQSANNRRLSDYYKREVIPGASEVLGKGQERIEMARDVFVGILEILSPLSWEYSSIDMLRDTAEVFRTMVRHNDDGAYEALRDGDILTTAIEARQELKTVFEAWSLQVFNDGSEGIGGGGDGIETREEKMVLDAAHFVKDWGEQYLNLPQVKNKYMAALKAAVSDLKTQKYETSKWIMIQAGLLIINDLKQRNGQYAEAYSDQTAEIYADLINGALGRGLFNKRSVIEKFKEIVIGGVLVELGGNELPLNSMENRWVDKVLEKNK